MTAQWKHTDQNVLGAAASWPNGTSAEELLETLKGESLENFSKRYPHESDQHVARLHAPGL